MDCHHNNSTPLAAPDSPLHHVDMGHSKDSKARSPEVGGGGPEISAGVVGNGTTTLGITDGSFERGMAVLRLIEEHARQLPGREAVRELARLAKEFPCIALRSPAFHDAVRFLRRRGLSSAVSQLLGEARRGRKFSSHFYLVMLMDQVMEEEGCRAAQAARIIAERHMADFMKSARSLENDYGRYRELYQLWRNGTYVDGSELTREALRPSAL
jgi:hypothetical protein